MTSLIRNASLLLLLGAVGCTAAKDAAPDAKARVQSRTVAVGLDPHRAQPVPPALAIWKGAARRR